MFIGNIKKAMLSLMQIENLALNTKIKSDKFMGLTYRET